MVENLSFRTPAGKGLGYSSGPSPRITPLPPPSDTGKIPLPDRFPSTPARTLPHANAINPWGESYGYYVKIQHDETYETLYAHCLTIFVMDGQEVQQGEVIALVGSTGNSTGNHLHFEVREDGVEVDAMGFFQKMEKSDNECTVCLSE